MNKIEQVLSILNELDEIDFCDFDTKSRVDIFNILSDLSYKIVDIKHPVLNVKLISSSLIRDNDYNPNIMASPEYKLLKHSIKKDGLTMPIIVSESNGYIHKIIDGSHRVKIIKNNLDIKNSFHSYIPTVSLIHSYSEQITSSVRHNVARGSHQVELTSKLIMKLKQSSWNNKKICEELGMDPDEVLRMQQITGLADAYKDEDFSFAWK
jgi:hypothetical protein